MNKNHIIIYGGRQQGKSLMQRQLLEKFMDDNPSAKACIVKANGDHEIIENAEFEVVEQKRIESGSK